MRKVEVEVMLFIIVGIAVFLIRKYGKTEKRQMDTMYLCMGLSFLVFVAGAAEVAALIAVVGVVQAILPSVKGRK